MAKKNCPVVVWVVVFRVMLYAGLRLTAKTFGLPSSYTHVLMFYIPDSARQQRGKLERESPHTCMGKSHLQEALKWMGLRAIPRTGKCGRSQACHNCGSHYKPHWK